MGFFRSSNNTTVRCLPTIHDKYAASGYVPSVGYRTSTLCQAYRWRNRPDKQKHLRSILARKRFHARKAAAEEEAAAEQEESTEEGAEGGEEGEAADKPKVDELGRPPLCEWIAHPYDYPWTEEERRECWWTEEELPRYLYDQIASTHLGLLDYPPPFLEELELDNKGEPSGPEAEYDEEDEDQNPYPPLPKVLTDPFDRLLLMNAMRAYEDEDAEETMDYLVDWYRDAHGPRPCLSQNTKDQINELHKLDPVNWNLDSLSLKFGTNLLPPISDITNLLQRAE